MTEHPTKIETRDVASGWQGVAHHGDGTCTKTWAMTESKARARAQEVMDS
jgi:hypothetical protein